MAYESFNNSLARTESGGRYDVVNDEGYGGKYQFGQARLDDFNRANGTDYTVAQLVQNPALQETVQDWHVSDIDNFVSENGLDRFIGQNIGGVTLTKDSLRAMAHLGGKGGMRKFLTTGGEYNPADSNDTSLLDYAGAHQGQQMAQGPQNALAQRQAPPQLNFRANYLDPADFMTKRNM